MKFFAALFVAFQLVLLPFSAAAQVYGGARTVSTETWVEEWDPASQRWVRTAQDPAELRASGSHSVVTTYIVNGVVVAHNEDMARYAISLDRQAQGTAVAAYGPFRVLDDRRAAIMGPTDRMSPTWFDAMLRDHPGLEVLEMVEAPGTNHDIANLAVGRRIRAAGLRTHVPQGGSVRSGAVELFLAGTRKSIDEGAEFAVHSWLDSYGREPDDFSPDHQANRMYLDYYVEMGMSEDRARQFYAMTNSVPHQSALWLGADDMRKWVRPEAGSIPARRVLDGIRGTKPVLARLEQPIAAPVLDLTTELALAHIPELKLAPSINYADISATSLARLDVDLLDS
ncbi:MAG: alpha/beta hydrolase [Erythrobacter sp.]|nr:alpha/beta hydrolase [Erythrobacter sp.]